MFPGLFSNQRERGSDWSASSNVPSLQARNAAPNHTNKEGPSAMQAPLAAQSQRHPLCAMDTIVYSSVTE